MRTFYRRPLLDRVTGRYTVEWESSEGPRRLTAHNRFTDLEGHLPSLVSLMRLPRVAGSYLAARRGPILAEPVPFLVWDAIQFLERTLVPGMRVLEIGSGNSTVWFLKRGCHVTSFEHSEDWARHVRDHVDEHLDARYARRLEQHVVAGDAAVRRIARLADASFDLALVDCMNEYTSRPDALRAARPKVASGGWMVLDNSDHPQNWPAVETMSDRDRLRFTGLAPMCAVVCQTSSWRV